MRIRTSSVRLRLTLWYTFVLAFIVLVFSVSVYLFVKGRLFQQLDMHLAEEFSEVASEVSEKPGDVHNSESENPSRLFQLAQGQSVYYQSATYRKAGLPDVVTSPASRYRTVRPASGDRFRLLTDKTKSGVLLTMAESEEPYWRTLRALSVILAMAFASALVLAAVGGSLLAGRLLNPLAAMAGQAEKIRAENLSDRLAVGNPRDELGRLANVFNQTLDRLENAFERQKRFAADASHELRTPLTAIQSVGEVALRENLDADAYRDRIGSMLEETARLTHLVESLLLLTRVESGRLRMDRKDLDVTELVEKAVDDMRIMAEEKGQKVLTQLPPSVRAVVDGESLRWAVVNLLDNAIKYTPEGGSITARLTEGPREIAIEVSDTGPGISAEHQRRIFDRFYRAERDRSQGIGGSGLGLAIAREAVEGNGGRIELDSRENHGSTFRIILPK